MTFRAPTIIPFVCLVVAFLVRLASIWPLLPVRLATHFDYSGQPNGWSTKSELLVILTGMLAIFVAGFISTFWLAHLPHHLINIPGKGYWLAAERRALTLSWLGEWARWFLIVTVSFVGAVIGGAIEANLAPPPHYTLPGWLFPSFACLVVGMLGWILWRLRMPR